jgi:hypothetical protein
MPAGARSTNEDRRYGKYEANAADIPPPREYPTRQNFPDSAPVHEIGDDARASMICVVKSRLS